jgi:hypothetical protein
MIPDAKDGKVKAIIGREVFGPNYGWMFSVTAKQFFDVQNSVSIFGLRIIIL